MIGKAGLKTTVSILGAAFLVAGTATAQTQPGYDYPEANDQQAPQGTSADDDFYGVEDDVPQGPQNKADEEDFSDVTGAEQSPPLPRRGDESSRRSGARDEDYAPEAQDADEREESAMADACALAARDEAERDGGYAEVRQMEAARDSRDGFSIDGDVEIRSGWRTQDGRMRHFTCTIANGRIQNVYFRRDRADR